MWKGIGLGVILACSATCANAASEYSAASFDKFVQTAKNASTDRQARNESWQKAVAEAEKPPVNSAQLAYALLHYADSFAGKDNEKTVALYKQAIEVRERSGATETMGMARNLLRYGMMKQALESQVFMNEAVKKANGDRDILRNLMKEQAQSSDVTSLLVRAMDVGEKTATPEAIRFQIMQCLAGMYVEAEKFEQAEKLGSQMVAFAEKPNNANVRTERMAGYGVLINVYGEQDRDSEMQAIKAKLDAATMDVPDAGQIKVIQGVYAAAEKIVDDSEELAFKKGKPSHQTLLPADACPK